jgi:methyl-accepting chemotaxis protein
MKFLTTMKSKMIISFLLITLIPIVSIGVIFSNKMQTKLQDDFEQNTRDEIKQVDKAMQLYFQGIDENTNFLSQYSIIQKADRTITTYMDATKQNNKIVMTPSKNGGIEQEIYNFYENFAKSHPNTAYIYMATKDGGYIQWPEGNTNEKYDPRQRPFYEKAMQNIGEITRTDAYFYDADQTSIVSTVKTITNQQGEVIGVQGLDVSLKGLTDMVGDIKIGENGYVMLLQQDGTILANPNDPNTIFKNINELKISQLNDVAQMKDQLIEGNINNVNNMMNIYTSPKTGWKFIAVQEKSAFTKQINEINMLIVFISILFLVLASIFAFVLASRFSKPILAIVSNLQTIATGDLSIEISGELKKRNDEIGQLAIATNEMQHGLKGLMQNVSKVTESLSSQSEELTQSSNEIKEGSEQIASTMQELSYGAESQANNSSSLAEMMEHFVYKIQEANKGGEAIAYTSNEVLSMTDEGHQLMQSSVEQMKTIDKIVKDAVKKVQGLDNQSKEISKLVQVIQDIAEQTNLLSLNAAIEAARAGEHGKGFAVVANEVRKLAEQVTNSVGDITDIVNDIQTESSTVVNSLEIGYGEVEQGSKQIEETGQTFNTINDAVSKMAEKIKNIATTLKDISENSTKMNNSIEEIASVSEESAAGVEQAAASAQQTSSSMEEVSNSADELAHLAEQLSDQISRFKL